MALTTASDFIIHYDWIIGQNDIVDSQYKVKQPIVLTSPNFGSEDGRYKFNVRLDTGRMTFYLIALNNEEHALYGFRLQISGLFNQPLQRRMPDFRCAEDAWLRWLPMNLDTSRPGLSISCDVEVAPRSRFHLSHSALKELQALKRRSSNSTNPKMNSEGLGESSLGEGTGTGARSAVSGEDSVDKSAGGALDRVDDANNEGALIHVDMASRVPIAGNSHCVTLMKNLWKMRRAKHLCDFCFVSKGQHIYLHKSVVSAVSDYLHQVCRVRNELEVHDAGPSAVESIVNWMYHGKIDLSRESLEDICIFAERYGVERLLEEIRRFLASTMQLENVIERLLLVSRLTNEEIKEAVIKFFKTNRDEVLRSEAWDEFNAAHPVEAVGALVAASNLRDV